MAAPLTGPQGLARGTSGRLLLAGRAVGAVRAWRIDLSPTTGRRVLFADVTVRRYWRAHAPARLTFVGRTTPPPYRYGRPKPPPARDETLIGEVVELTARGVVLREITDDPVP